VRRPRRTSGGASLLRSLLDLVLLPFRLLYALFQYLNFFTARYTGRPLTTAGGAKQGADLRRLLQQSRVADAAEGADEDEAAEGGVPRSWKLVRCEPGGRETVIAAGVSRYDLAPDGALLFCHRALASSPPPGGLARSASWRGTS
jgi:hypothetical protein